MVTTVTERPQSRGDDAKAEAKRLADEAKAKAAEEAKQKAEEAKAKAAEEAKAKAAAEAKAKAAAEKEKARVAAEAKEEKRRQWLERAEQEITAAGEIEPQRDPEAIAKQLDAMAERAREAEILEPHDKTNLRERVHLAKRVMYERHVDHLLDRAMAASHDRTREKERNEILKDAQAKFTVAMKLGSSSDVREAVRARLGIIRETSAAGTSQKAKENAEREALRKEAAYQNERRVFTRWSDPPLVVVIGTRTYATANWSLGGLLIEEFAGETRKAGDEIEIKVGLDQARLYSERVEIVRLEEKRLALKSRRFASVLLQIKRDCDADGLEPA